jgi:hypothetical protein
VLIGGASFSNRSGTLHASQHIAGASDIQRIFAVLRVGAAAAALRAALRRGQAFLAEIRGLQRFCDIVSLAIQGMRASVIHSRGFILGWFPAKSGIISFMRWRAAGVNWGK